MRRAGRARLLLLGSCPLCVLMAPVGSPLGVLGGSVLMAPALSPMKARIAGGGRAHGPHGARSADLVVQLMTCLRKGASAAPRSEAPHPKWMAHLVQIVSCSVCACWLPVKESSSACACWLHTGWAAAHHRADAAAARTQALCSSFATGGPSYA